MTVGASAHSFRVFPRFCSQISCSEHVTKLPLDARTLLDGAVQPCIQLYPYGFQQYTAMLYTIPSFDHISTQWDGYGYHNMVSI